MQAKDLEKELEYSESFDIDLQSERRGQKIDVTFKVRTPCKETFYITKMKPVFQLTRIYPPFNIKGGNNKDSGIKIEVQQEKVTADDLNVNNEIKKTPVNVSGPKKVIAQKQAPAPVKKVQKPGGAPAGKPKQGGPPPAKKKGPPKEIIDKSEFKDEELKDPDCINNLNTLQVLEFKLNKYEEIRSKIDGRTPRELMQRIVKIKCKIQTLTDSMGDEITPQDYYVLLRTTFEHDKKLVTYFTQQKDTEKSKLVSERLPLIIKETEELMKQMPKK